MSEVVNGEVVAARETGSCISVIRSKTHRRLVLESKHDNAVVSSSRDFRKMWAQSIGEPKDYLSQRFSHLKTGNQHVVVTPRVPNEGVLCLHE